MARPHSASRSTDSSTEASVSRGGVRTRGASRGVSGRGLRRLVVRALGLVGVVAGAALSAGCDAQLTSAGPRSLTYTEDAQKAYREALTAFREKDWESAKALFQEVKKRFPQAREARLAELRLADIDFAQEKYSEAISAYRGFVTTFRSDREVEYARYRLAKALYFDIDDTILLPPAEERDQGTTADAQRELKSFMKTFPRSRYRKDIEFMLEVVTGRLVRHELYVARYYRRRDNYEAALSRLDYALKTYPHSGLDPEALVLKGETLLMLNRRKEAKLAFEAVVNDWGGAFVPRAKAYLAELGAPSQPPPTISRPPDPGVPAGAKAAPTPEEAPKVEDPKKQHKPMVDLEKPM
jgi:outer membrane protein assembly factor BamD